MLKISGIARATYYYQVSKVSDTEEELLIGQIRKLFQEHKGRYGYPRITLALQQTGLSVNRKKVARIMREQGLYARKPRVKYSSYRGDIGKRADNILAQDFAAAQPYQKLGTDVSVFITPFGKLYLSPVIVHISR